VDKITVSRWAKRLASSEQGEGNVSDLPRSGRPSTAVKHATMQRADRHIRNDRRITTREIAAILGIGKGCVDKIIHQLGYSKCVPDGPSNPNQRAYGTSARSCLLVTRFRVTISCSQLSRVMRHRFIT
jgi:hypothetical protein